MSTWTNLLTPSGITYVLCLGGLVALISKRTRHLAMPSLAAGAICTLLFSSGLIAAALIRPLEYSQPALRDATAHPHAKHIVVLTGWAGDDQQMPLSGRMNSSSAYRVLLAFELFKTRPDCAVVVSGEPRTARTMAAVLRNLGVDAAQLSLETASTSTAESAKNLQSMVGPDSFFLVTSGGHMPRSLAVMRKVGLNPIAAPTDHQMPSDWRTTQWAPRPSSLTASDLALHEYVAQAWYRLRGWM